MQAFPLIRTKWSNEHIMALLFSVLVLYMLPGMIDKKNEFINFLVILAIALALDFFFNIILRKQVLCSVSAAVTAAILQILSPGAALPVKLLGIAAALVIGKFIWGGTGKNPINPALTGVILICLLSPHDGTLFTSTYFLVPALILSIPFLIFRPFAGMGFIVGASAINLFTGNLDLSVFLSAGIIFWGTIIMTDPVTITPDPVLGGLLGVLGGILSQIFSSSLLFIAIAIILINVLSLLLSKFESKFRFKSKIFIKKRKYGLNLKGNPEYFDLTDDNEQNRVACESISGKEILKRIRDNEVYGFGGAAFPAVTKIEGVINSETKVRHLIINAIECDPGLLHDKWLIENKPEEIIKGINALSKAAAFNSITLAVKEGTIIKAFTGSNLPESFKIFSVPDYYPVGAERFLIKEVLGIKIDENVIPSKAGILVFNLQTVFKIYEAVYLNKKADSKFITVADIRNNTGNIARVKLGMQIASIAGKILGQNGSIFTGGGIMQCRNTSTEDVIEKCTNFIALSDFPRYKESLLCSRCGFCNSACPVGLPVNTITSLVDSNEMEKLQYYNPKSCLQCGSCSQVCLAGRNLANRMKTAREYVKSL